MSDAMAKRPMTMAWRNLRHALVAIGNQDTWRAGADLHGAELWLKAAREKRAWAGLPISEHAKRRYDGIVTLINGCWIALGFKE